MSHPPVVLAIGGLDPTGHAGLAADLRAGGLLGAMVAPVTACLTVQDQQGVKRVVGVDPELLKQMIGAALSSLPVGAVKIGLLGGVAQAQAVAEALAGVEAPIILDPVLGATNGGSLSEPELPGALAKLLFPKLALLTPNIPEAQRLLGHDFALDQTGMETAAAELRVRGPEAVLLKGGHAGGPQATDYLCDAHGLLWIQGPRLETPNTRGTGCSLASLIAVLMAKGQPLRLACIGAKDALNIMIAKGAGSTWPGGAGPAGC